MPLDTSRWTAEARKRYERGRKRERMRREAAVLVKTVRLVRLLESPRGYTIRELERETGEHYMTIALRLRALEMAGLALATAHDPECPWRSTRYRLLMDWRKEVA